MCIHTGQKTGPKISCDSPFKHLSRGYPIQASGISQRFFFTLIAVPSGCPIDVKRISRLLLAKTLCNFCQFSFNQCFNFFYDKHILDTHRKIFITLIVATSPDTDLSNNITPSQSQSLVTES
jgi:hypothetical protein